MRLLNRDQGFAQSHFGVEIVFHQEIVMAEQREFFADGIGQIHFIGGMVRSDLVTLQPAEEGKAPVPESCARVIMPVQGFLSTLNSMQQLVDKLVAAGVLKKNEQAR